MRGNCVLLSVALLSGATATAAAQTADRVSSGAVIAVTVVDPQGEPQPGVIVRAQHRETDNGRIFLSPAGRSGVTDDRGRIRLSALAAGEYYVTADPVDLLDSIDQDGRRRGDAFTLYPAATRIDEAQALKLADGDVIQVALTMQRTPLTRVSGTLLEADGRVAENARIIFMPRDSVAPPPMPVPVGRDGAFALLAPPGTYRVDAFADVDAHRDRLGPLVVAASLTVSAADMTGVVLRAARQATIRGRIVGAAADLAAIDWSQVTLMMASLERPPKSFPFEQSAVGDDLQFSLHAWPGPVILGAATRRDPPPPNVIMSILGDDPLSGRAIESVSWHGRDVTDGFDVPDGAVDDELVITITGALGRLIVTATDALGKPLADHLMVVVPSDPARRHLRMGHGNAGRTDKDGRYQTPPLIAGDYLVAASTIDSRDWASPDVLRRVLAGAAHATVLPAVNSTVVLRVR